MRESDAGKRRALEAFPFLQDFVGQLEIYEALLRRWQRRINLISAATLDQIWWRHFADSIQLHPAYLPSNGERKAQLAKSVDLGSGAGFPGLILAITGVPEVTLVESDTRKAAFLREVSRETERAVEVRTDRAEAFVREQAAPGYVVSRAFAPLANIVELASAWLADGSELRLLVGEATEATTSDKLCITHIPSRVGSGFVLQITRNESGHP